MRSKRRDSGERARCCRGMPAASDRTSLPARWPAPAGSPAVTGYGFLPRRWGRVADARPGVFCSASWSVAGAPLRKSLRKFVGKCLTCPLSGRSARAWPAHYAGAYARALGRATVELTEVATC